MASFQPVISTRSGLTAVVPQKAASTFRRPGSPHASRIVETTIEHDFQSVEQNASIGTLSRVAPIPTLQRANMNVVNNLRGAEDVLDYTAGSQATRMGISDADTFLRCCGMRRQDTMWLSNLIAATTAGATTLYITELTAPLFTTDGTTAREVYLTIGWGTATGETKLITAVRQATLTITANFTGGSGDTLQVASSAGVLAGDKLVIDVGDGANREVGTVLSVPDATHVQFTANPANNHAINDLIRLDALVVVATTRNHSASDRVFHDWITYLPETSQSQIRDAAVPTAVAAAATTINLMPGTASQFITGDQLALGSTEPNRETVTVVSTETGAATTYSSTSAADTIVVPSSTGFAANDVVWIGRGTANAERKIVLAIPDGTHIQFTTAVGAHVAAEVVEEEDTVTIIGAGTGGGTLFPHNKITYVSASSTADGINKTITVPSGGTTNLVANDTVWIAHGTDHEEAIVVASVTATTIVATSVLVNDHDPGEIVTATTLEATDTVFEVSAAHQDDGGQSSTTPLESRLLGLRGEAQLIGSFGEITRWEFQLAGGFEDFTDPQKASATIIPRQFVPVLPTVQPQVFAQTCLYVGPVPEYEPTLRSFNFKMGNGTVLIPDGCTDSGISGQAINSRRVQLEFVVRMVPPSVFDWVGAFKLGTQIQYRLEVRKTSRRRLILSITKGVVSGVARENIDDIWYFRVTVDAIVQLGLAPTGDNEFSIVQY